MHSKLQTLFQWLSLTQTVFSIPVSQICSRDDGPPALQAINTLQNTWYDPSSGLWSNLWWNSANCLTTITNFHQTNPSGPSFTAQAMSIYESSFRSAFTVSQPDIGKHPGSFLNSLYDDEGWWALAWIQVYDATGNATYLSAARDIYTDMKAGLNKTSCGGLIWQKGQNLISSIENSIFLDVAAKLALRIANTGDGLDEDYLSTALTQYEWFFNQAGLLSPNTSERNALVPDGLNPTTCVPEGRLLTYNQGTTIGALVSLSQLPPKSITSSSSSSSSSSSTTNTNSQIPSPESLLDLATSLALASITHFSTTPDHNNILTEDCDPACDTTASQFKGIFVRNLMYLQRARPRADFRDFILANAAAIWRNKEKEEEEESGGGGGGGGGGAARLGSAWGSEYAASSAAEASEDGKGGMGVGLSAMCSGLDGLVAAGGVDKS